MSSPITVTAMCGSCNNLMQGPSGAVVACPTCGAQLTMPAAAPVAAAAVVPAVTGAGTLPPVAANPFDELARTTTLCIKQNVSLTEALTGFETKNKYQAFRLDASGAPELNPIFHLLESSTCMQRQCCGSSREFEMKVLTGTNQEFMKIHRPFKCGCCISSNEMMISGMDDSPLGSIYVHFTWCDDKITVNGPTGEPEFIISGACCQAGRFCMCPCAPFDKVEFLITPVGASEPTGNISKVYAGCAKEALTDAGNFTITFPPSASAVQRAVLMGALMMIDFMFFETTSEN